MVSAVSNASSASALAILTGSTKALAETQKQMSSGLKVKDASDNAAYWSIATTTKSQNLALSTADDATGLAAAITDTASLGIQASADIVSEIQSKLILAKSLGDPASMKAINSEISDLKSQLGTIAESSSFNGQNWLSAEKPNVESMVASVNQGPSGVSINTIQFDTSNSMLVGKNDAQDGIVTKSYTGTNADGSTYEYYLLSSGSANPPPASASEIALSEDTTSSEIDGMISSVNSIFAKLTDAGTQLGVTSNRIASSSEMMKDLKDVNDIGLSRLVDADMGEVAARLKADQVQQQLQTQALNIANQTNSRNLTMLFL